MSIDTITSGEVIKSLPDENIENESSSLEILDKTKLLKTPKGRQEYLYDRFAAHYGHEMAVALCANIGHETGGSYHPLQMQKGGGKALGLCQRAGERLRLLKKQANWKDIDAQIDYIIYELSGPESQARQKISGAVGVAAKTKAVTKYYERPGKPNYASRIRMAHTIDTYIARTRPAEPDRTNYPSQDVLS